MKTTLKKLSIPKPKGGFDELYIDDFVTEDKLLEKIKDFRNLIYKLHFEKDEVTDMHPFYIKSLEDENVVYNSTITCRLSTHADDVEYSYGDSWVSLSDVETISLDKGERVYFRYVGENYLSGVSNNTEQSRLTTTTKTFDVGGDIRTLMFGNTTEESVPERGMEYLFYNSNVVDASKLLLKATILADSCYKHMFYGCTGLTQAPELPATTLANSCCSYMFYGCSNLNYIKCLATYISDTDCTTDWVSGVASTGTFVKEAGVNWTTGTSGIPSGWTVEEV